MIGSMNKSVFVDESGNLDFSSDGTKYFILGSVTMESCDIGAELLDLRRHFATKGQDLPTGFHAAEDKQAVRNEVFKIIARHDFRFDATIFEKAKAYPRIRQTPVDFYNFAWYFHLKHLMPIIGRDRGHVFVAAATINLKWKREQAIAAISTAVRTTIEATPFSTVAWDCGSDPCLQAADDCCWALQRKLVKNDDRSDGLIEEKIKSQHDLFRWERHFTPRRRGVGRLSERISEEPHGLLSPTGRTTASIAQ